MNDQELRQQREDLDRQGTSQTILSAIEAAKAPPGKPDFWLCKACGCLWRDNRDGTVSLASVKQASCAVCEGQTDEATCEPLWRRAAPDRTAGNLQDADSAENSTPRRQRSNGRHSTPRPAESDPDLLRWAASTAAEHMLARASSGYERERWARVLRLTQTKDGQ